MSDRHLRIDWPWGYNEQMNLLSIGELTDLVILDFP